MGLAHRARAFSDDGSVVDRQAGTVAKEEGSADSKTRTRTRRTLHRHRSYDGQCTSVAKDPVEVEAEDASMIKRCVRCGSTIKAGQTYFVRPQLVTKVNSRGRRFNIWTRPYYHANCNTEKGERSA